MPIMQILKTHRPTYRHHKIYYQSLLATDVNETVYAPSQLAVGLH